MKITFLGTGTSQGVPVIGCPCAVCQSNDARDKRLRSSVMIEDEGKCFVIDTGPDFRQQMLRANAKTLTAVIFTHEHKDHTAGFDDIRAFNYIEKKKIEVYGNSFVEKALRREYPYVFEDEKYPGVPEINFHLIENKSFKIEETIFLPIEVMHYKLPVFGFRVKDFSYVTDANHISAKEKEKIKGSKVLVLNALMREKHISHFSFDEAIALAQELRAETTYFTHISHRLGLHKEVEKELPESIRLGFDGLEVEIK